MQHRFNILKALGPARGKWIGMVLAVFLVWMAVPGFAREKESFPVTDFRGKTVMVPKEINRVVTISDGMIAGVMTRLGEAHKIVGIGSACIPKIWSCEYPALKGDPYVFKDGINPVTLLNPGLRDLPLVAKFGVGIKYEAVAALEPDLIIIRTGSCTLGQGPDILDKIISLLDALGIPLVVLHGPNATDEPTVASISKEILLLGRVFQKETQARGLAEYLESTVAMIQKRTRDIPEEERKRILLLGLSPKARSQGGAGHVKGNDTLQSYILKHLVNAENAYTGSGAWNILNTEQVLALDPDLVILVTAWGYHPPEELYEAPYYEGLRQMRAVKAKAVAPLPWTPCNCEKRLEYPIDIMVMAKAAYPERFRDINLGEWLLDFYRNVYNVDDKTARRILSGQWMDWALAE